MTIKTDLNREGSFRATQARSPALLILGVNGLALRSLFVGVLFRKMPPDDATADRADHSVMARVVSRDAADHGALDATRRMCCPADGEKQRCGGECGFPESGHADTPFVLIEPMLRQCARFQ
ncbi:hypothetical protein BCAR13_520015 [Paraburkholderia caribensis]|nr:hypothetical protein BCAR13_520015 [Paraburkholderia caribensis]